jgi:hypothetical protein
MVLLPALPTFAQTKSQKLTFTNFNLVISNFYSECYSYTRFPGEGEKRPKIIDTIFICETPCEDKGWYIDGQAITVSSKTTNDSYEIAYAIEYDISQQFDDRGGKSPAEGWEAWEKKARNRRYISGYKTLKRIAATRFRLPGRAQLAGANDVKAIRQKFGLRDTLIVLPREVGETRLVFAKGGKLFSNTASYIRLSVKRFSGGILKETRYVVIGISEGCD